MPLFIASILIFIINIPFGYWRENVKKFSLQWFLSIHIPIFFIIIGRIYTKMGFIWYTYIFTITAFVAGQYLGKLFHKNLKEKNSDLVSSFIFVDLIKLFRQA